MMVRWISLVPPGIVHSQDPMKSSTQAPGLPSARHRLAQRGLTAEAGDLRAEVGHPLEKFAVVQLHDRRVGRGGVVVGDETPRTERAGR